MTCNLIHMAVDTGRDFESLFSIVIPVLNEETNIQALLQSIFAQTHRPIEVIVVDDGSTDRTAELTEKLADKFNDEHFRITLIKAKNFEGRSRGPAFARNLGINCAHGSYVLLVDGDFILTDTGIISELFLALANNHAARFRANVQIDSWLEYNLSLDNKAPIFRRKMGSVSGIAFRKQVLEEFHFDTSLGTGEDTDLLGRIAKKRSLKPTIVSAMGVKHDPHTLAELKDQRQWQGRTALLWLRKHHSVRDLLALARVVPFALLVGQLIGYLFNTVLGLASTGGFLIIIVVLFFRSPTKDVSRMGYLVFIRLVLGSFFFSVGIIEAIVQLVLHRRIDPSRGK